MPGKREAGGRLVGKKRNILVVKSGEKSYNTMVIFKVSF